MNYLIVNKQTGVIENVIVWDGEAEYAPPDGTDVVPSNGQQIGEVYQK